VQEQPISAIKVLVSHPANPVHFQVSYISFIIGIRNSIEQYYSHTLEEVHLDMCLCPITGP